MSSKKSVIFTWVSPNDVAVAMTRMKSELLPDASRKDKGQFSILVEDEAFGFPEIVVLYDDKLMHMDIFKAWCKTIKRKRIRFKNCGSVDTKDYNTLYNIVTPILLDYQDYDRGYLISGGSKAMGLVWILVNVNVKYRGTLYNVYDLEGGDRGVVQKLNLPFDIDATYIGDYLNQETFANWKNLKTNDHIVAISQEMREVYKKATHGAELGLHVMVYGESGTGKELVAKLCAEAAKRPEIITINCGALPKDLVESELFGHTKGAFTGADTAKEGLFEKADGKTLFLDEIGELPLDAQTKLLRVLQEKKVRRVGGSQEKKVDVFLVTATNRQLHKEVEAGNFREDLYYRLMVWPVTLPPLRDRDPKDVRGLVQFLWDTIQKRMGRIDSSMVDIPRDAMKLLVEYPWPGNIRQLENTLNRVFGLSFSGELKLEHIREAMNVPVPLIKDHEVRKASSMEHHLAHAFIERFEEVYQLERTQKATAETLKMDASTMKRNYEAYCKLLGQKSIFSK